MTRRGRIHWTKSDNPYPLEMIQMGMQTLWSLHLFPALTSSQVSKLHFRGMPNLDGILRQPEAADAAANRYCLRRLKDLGLVKVKAIPRLDNPMHKWEMNYLTKAGYEALVDHRQALGLQTSSHRSPASITYQTINPHSMGIIDAGISAMVGARVRGYDVVQWLSDLDIRSLLKSDRLYWPMEPDALLVLSHAGQRQAYFLEVDRGTESGQSPRANSWSTKMGKYATYFKGLRATDPWMKDLPQPDVMVVTTSTQRLENLKRITAEGGGKSAYWFTVSEYLESPYNFFGEVWLRIGSPDYHSPASRFPS